MPFGLLACLYLSFMVILNWTLFLSVSWFTANYEFSCKPTANQLQTIAGSRPTGRSTMTASCTALLGGIAVTVSVRHTNNTRTSIIQMVCEKNHPLQVVAYCCLQLEPLLRQPVVRRKMMSVSAGNNTNMNTHFYSCDWIQFLGNYSSKRSKRRLSGGKSLKPSGWVVLQEQE